MDAVRFNDRASAEAAIAEKNRKEGYPRTEEGVRVGGGRFVDLIVTESSAEPLPTKDGKWVVPADAIDAKPEERVVVTSADLEVAIVEEVNP
jgi:hypothetical protein